MFRFKIKNLKLSKSGFTLIEVVIAVALSSVIIMGILKIFHSVDLNREKIEKRMAEKKNNYMFYSWIKKLIGQTILIKMNTKKGYRYLFVYKEEKKTLDFITIFPLISNDKVISLVSLKFAKDGVHYYEKNMVTPSRIYDENSRKKYTLLKKNISLKDIIFYYRERNTGFLKQNKVIDTVGNHNIIPVGVKMVFSNEGKTFDMVSFFEINKRYINVNPNEF